MSVPEGHDSLTAPATAGEPVLTPHVVSATWSEARGWGSAEVMRLENVRVHPGSLGLHYSQIVFEGFRAHPQKDGSFALFRPIEHARRLRCSALRLAMPEVPEDLLLRAVDDLVRIDRASLPDDGSAGLYLRPLLMADEIGLPPRPARSFRLMVMGFVLHETSSLLPAPIRVWVSREHARAVPGGTGNVKCAANYAAAFLAQQRASDARCQQVLWLDPLERKWVEELSGMNLFFVERGQLVTPPLDGTILPGVTRDSLMHVAGSLGYRVREERMALDEWRSGCATGQISETFSCGTATAVTPIGAVVDLDSGWRVADGMAGPVTAELAAALAGVQRGTRPDPASWMRPVRSDVC
jgi:branched-chain amino acid aminotransferase